MTRTWFGVVLLLAGLLAMAPLIVARKPQARAVFDRLAAWRGIVGLVVLVVGVLGAVKYGAAFVGGFLASPLQGAIGIATILVAIVLGFLLSQSLLVQLPVAATVKARFEDWSARLHPHQVALGIAAALLGVYTLI